MQDHDGSFTANLSELLPYSSAYFGLCMTAQSHFPAIPSSGENGNGTNKQISFVISAWISGNHGVILGRSHRG